MKNAIMLTLMLLIGGITFAQRSQGPATAKTDWTPEQKAELKTKKMALALDLSEDQQSKLLEFNKQWAQKHTKLKEQFQKQRAENDSLTPDQKFDHRSQMLDLQLAYQQQMQDLLSTEQYEEWKSMRKRGRYSKGRHSKARHSKGRYGQGMRGQHSGQKPAKADKAG